MAIKLIQRQILLADVESSYGVPASLTGADAILIENFTHSPGEQATLLERGGLTGSLSLPARSLVGRLAGYSFDAELKGNSAGVAPEIGPLLRACGLRETVNAGVDVVYDTQVSAGQQESMNCDYWDGGADRHVGIGSRGILSIMLEAGSYAKASFQFQAHPTAPAAAARPTPAYNANTPEPLKQVTMEIGGFGAWEVYSATLNMNTTISAPPALTTPYNSGYSEVLITEFNPELVVSIAAQDIADGYDPYAAWEAGTTATLQIGPHGDPNNRFEIVSGQAIVQNITTGDQEGRLTYEITYQLSESSLGASDNFTLTFD